MTTELMRRLNSGVKSNNLLIMCVPEIRFGREVVLDFTAGFRLPTSQDSLLPTELIHDEFSEIELFHLLLSAASAEATYNIAHITSNRKHTCGKRLIISRLLAPLRGMEKRMKVCTLWLNILST